MTRLASAAQPWLMVRRTPSRSYFDERAFPVRVALAAVDESGAVCWTDAELWLKENIGDGDYAHHGLRSHAPYAMAFYFRTVDDAQRFTKAFPHYQLADSTERLEHLRKARQTRCASEVEWPRC